MTDSYIGIITIDAKMFSVATGAAESMKNLSYQGEVDGLITEMEILSWEMLGLQVPKELQEKRRLGTQAYLQQQAGVAPQDPDWCPDARSSLPRPGPSLFQ